MDYRKEIEDIKSQLDRLANGLDNATTDSPQLGEVWKDCNDNILLISNYKLGRDNQPVLISISDGGYYGDDFSEAETWTKVANTLEEYYFGVAKPA